MTATRRLDEISRGLRTVQGLIADAAADAGRDPGEVTLIVVTKTFPTSDIRLLAGLGVRDVGENRHQDAVTKAAELADLNLRWHFIGQVQSNKAPRIASYADVVHSLDSIRSAHRLGTAAAGIGRTLTALLQVSLDHTREQAAGRGGVAPADVPAFAREISGTSGLRLGGIMGVAPLGEPPDEAFARLCRVSQQLQREYPTATIISAGMSSDFAAAVRAGATHVRVGSAVLGARPPLR